MVISNQEKWYVYVIESIPFNFRYIGMSKNVVDRLKLHNYGKVKSTKARKPYKLIYYEFAGNRQNARILEKYYKSGAGRRKIQRMINNNNIIL